MTMIKVVFYVMSLVAVASALFVAASRNLVRSVFMFFVTLMAIAGLYVIARADFIAITQIVIYVGGILVLMIFAFMLSGKETLAGLQQQENRFISIHKLPALLLATLFFIVLANVFLKTDSNNLIWVQNAVLQQNTVTPGDVTVNNIGINLMSHYLLPFEVVSILLMMALVGAAHISRKEKAV